MTAHRILTIGVVVAALAAGSVAHAASGVVKGTLQLWERNGGFCPATGRDCSGSNFPASSSNSYQPLANAKVYVFMQSGSAQVQIGQGLDGPGHHGRFAPVKAGDAFPAALLL